MKKLVLSCLFCLALTAVSAADVRLSGVAKDQSVEIRGEVINVEFSSSKMVRVFIRTESRQIKSLDFEGNDFATLGASFVNLLGEEVKVSHKEDGQVSILTGEL